MRGTSSSRSDSAKRPRESAKRGKSPTEQPPAKQTESTDKQPVQRKPRVPRAPHRETSVEDKEPKSHKSAGATVMSDDKSEDFEVVPSQSASVEREVPSDEAVQTAADPLGVSENPGNSPSDKPAAPREKIWKILKISEISRNFLENSEKF